MSYGNEAEFSSQTAARTSSQGIAQRQAAIARQQQIQQQNLQVEQQRQQAPSAVSKGSPQDIAIRSEAAKAEQQRLVAENIHQLGYSSSLYESQREQAMKAGKFDYSSVRSAFYSPPPAYVNVRGETVQRPSTAPPDIATIGTSVSQAARPTPKTGRAPSDIMTLQTSRTTPQTPKPTEAPTIQISQQQLKITDALRKMKGLAPLETAQKVSVVKGTQTLPPSKEAGSEVSSFLKFPFAGEKVSGGGIPSTSLIDVAVFLPMPLGIAEKAGALIKPVESLFIKEFEGITGSAVSKAAKTGAADIGLNVQKYTHEFQTQKNISDLIREKQLAPPMKATTEGTKEFSSKEVSLGVGPGRTVSKGGGTSALDILGKGPGEKPAPSPTEKTVSVGKGLEQIVKQKETPKTKLRAKPEFEQRQATKQEQFLKQQETKAGTKTETVQNLLERQMKKEKPKTEQEKAAQQFEQLVEKSKTEQITKPKEEGIPIFITKPIQTTKQKRRTGEPLIPLFVPIQTPIQTTKTGQKQETGLGITDLISLTVTKGPPTKTPPPQTPPPSTPLIPPTEEPPTKKTPPDLFGTLGGSLTGGGGRGSAQGAVKAFRGNVPVNDIVGVYKRSEISYNPKTVAGRDILSSHAAGKFVKRGSKGKIF